MNKEKKMRINAVMSFMPTGRENAVSMMYIAQMTKKSQRDIRLIVNEARLEGHMIVGDDSGYYLAETDEELVEYYFRLRSRETTTQSIRRAVKGSLMSRGIDPDQEGTLYDK